LVAFVAVAALVAFLAGLAAGVSATPAAALASASYVAWRLTFSGATSSGGGAGRPLNRCQSPVFWRSRCTASLGCAPTESQYCTRSLFTWMTDGSSLGW
jgi:hypothetical protein